MADSNGTGGKANAADKRTVVEAARGHLDTAVKAAKDNPAAAAGIAAGVVAAAAGVAYGASALKAKKAGTAEDEALIIDPQRVPEEIPSGK